MPEESSMPNKGEDEIVVAATPDGYKEALERIANYHNYNELRCQCKQCCIARVAIRAAEKGES